MVIIHALKIDTLRIYSLSTLGVPMKLVDGIRGFYSQYITRLRIGTKLTAPFFVTTGTT
jgi:hypothetical protein